MDARTQPLVTIVTVVFNGADAIATTIDSTLAQNTSLFEHLIIDGGSTDGTLAILDAYRDRVHTIISEPDRGIYDAMNKGLRLARGRWIYFLNSGDEFSHPRVLTELAPALESDEYDVIAGHFVLSWSDLEAAFAPERLGVGRMPSCHQALFVRTSRAKQCEFDPSFRVGADYDMICRVLHERESRLLLSTTVVARVKSEGFSASNRFTAVRDYRHVASRHFGTLRSSLWFVRTVSRMLVSSAIRSVVGGRAVRSLRRVLYGRQ
jgi:glycosyltransferase involved in cell wall biosynthesis